MTLVLSEDCLPEPGRFLTRSAGTGGAAGENALINDPPRGRVLGVGPDVPI